RRVRDSGDGLGGRDQRDGECQHGEGEAGLDERQARRESGSRQQGSEGNERPADQPGEVARASGPRPVAEDAAERKTAEGAAAGGAPGVGVDGAGSRNIPPATGSPASTISGPQRQPTADTIANPSVPAIGRASAWAARARPRARAG